MTNININNLDELRDWLKNLPCDPRVRRARLMCFDLMRYREDYAGIFVYIQTIKEFGSD